VQATLIAYIDKQQRGKVGNPEDPTAFFPMTTSACDRLTSTWPVDFRFALGAAALQRLGLPLQHLLRGLHVPALQCLLPRRPMARGFANTRIIRSHFVLSV
jgi:hypothetical protein